MHKSPITLLLILAFLLFVGIGDQILPQPLSSASLSTRTTLNKHLAGLFPKWQPKTKPNQRTEKALEAAEDK